MSSSSAAAQAAAGRTDPTDHTPVVEPVPDHPALQRLSLPVRTTFLSGALVDQQTRTAPIPLPMGLHDADAYRRRCSKPTQFQEPRYGAEKRRLLDAYMGRQALLVIPDCAPHGVTVRPQRAESLRDAMLCGETDELARAAREAWRRDEAARQQQFPDTPPSKHFPKMEECVYDTVAFSGAPARDVAVTILILSPKNALADMDLVDAAQFLARAPNASGDRAVHDVRMSLLVGTDAAAYTQRNLGTTLAALRTAADRVGFGDAPAPALASVLVVASWAQAAEPAAGDAPTASPTPVPTVRQHANEHRRAYADPQRPGNKQLPPVARVHRAVGEHLAIDFDYAVAPLVDDAWRGKKADAVFAELKRAVLAAFAAARPRDGRTLHPYRLAEPYSGALDGAAGVPGHYLHGVAECAAEFAALHRLDPKLQLHPRLTSWYLDTHKLELDEDVLIQPLQKYNGNLVPVRTCDDPETGALVFVRLVPFDLLHAPELAPERLPEGAARNAEIRRRTCHSRVVHGILLCEAGKRADALQYVMTMRANEMRATAIRLHKERGTAPSEALVRESMGPFWLENVPGVYDGSDQRTEREIQAGVEPYVHPAAHLGLHVLYVAYDVAPIDRHLSHYGLSEFGEVGTPLVNMGDETRHLLELHRAIVSKGGARMVPRTYAAVAAVGGELLRRFFVAPCDRGSAFVDPQALQARAERGQTSADDHIDALEASILTQALQDAVTLHLPLFQDTDELAARHLVTSETLHALCRRFSGPTTRAERDGGGSDGTAAFARTRRPLDLHEGAILHELGLDATQTRLAEAHHALSQRTRGSSELVDLLGALRDAVGDEQLVTAALRFAAEAVGARARAERARKRTHDDANAAPADGAALAAQLEEARAEIKRLRIQAASPLAEALKLDAAGRATLLRMLRLSDATKPRSVCYVSPDADKKAKPNLTFGVQLLQRALDFKPDAGFSKEQQRCVMQHIQAHHAAANANAAAAEAVATHRAAHYLAAALAGCRKAGVAKACDADVIVLYYVGRNNDTLLAYLLTDGRPVPLSVGQLVSVGARPKTAFLGWLDATSTYWRFARDGGASDGANGAAP